MRTVISDLPGRSRRAAVILWLVLAWTCAGADGADPGTPPESVPYPTRPLKVVVPFAPGGGSDLFVRILQKAINEQNLFGQPWVVVNYPGAGGTIGSRRVRDARPDGYTILNLHDGILTAKFSGTAPYGPEAFLPIAATGETGEVLAVGPESGAANLQELMAATREVPGSVALAANLGAPSHFAGLLLEQAAPGSRFRFVQTGGGAKRFASLAGGHVDASTFSIAEYLQFRGAGLRALAYLGPERHTTLPDLPTAREQGFDVTTSLRQFWWAPRGTPPERVAHVARTLERAMRHKEVLQRLSELRMDPVFLQGKPLKQEVKARENALARVDIRPTVPLPDFSFWILAATVILGLASCWKSPNAATRVIPESTPNTPIAWGRLAAAGLALALYAGTFAIQWPDFRLSTFLFVVVLGGLCHETGTFSNSLKASLTSIALILAVGGPFVFARLLSVDLP